MRPTARCGVNCSGNRGMTLIEMLVVLLIMGLLTSVTVLSVGMVGRTGRGDADAALTVAEDLSRLFEHASQQALATHQVLGWGLTGDQAGGQQMRWWRWSSLPPSQSPLSPAPAGQVPVWLADEETMSSELVLPDNLLLQLNPRSLTVSQPDSVPAVVFFPGREYSAFEIYVRDTELSTALARVWSERDGSIRWAAL